MLTKLACSEPTSTQCTDILHDWTFFAEKKKRFYKGSRKIKYVQTVTAERFRYNKNVVFWQWVSPTVSNTVTAVSTTVTSTKGTLIKGPS